MTDLKIIAVAGATGRQGGGVVDALLSSGRWKVRALARNTTSDSAKALAARGVEVVAADLNKAEDLERAFTGAYGVFHVTQFYDASTKSELDQGKLAIDAAKKVGVQHFIYSSLVDAEKISGGENKVHHFTGKAKVEEYLFQSGIPATTVQICCYFENWLDALLPRPNAEDGYEFTIPVPLDSKFAVGSVSDLGHVVLKVLDNKDKYLNQSIAVAYDLLSPNDIAAGFTKVWGKQVTAKYVPPAVFAQFPFPLAGEMADMFDFFHKFGYYGEKVTGRDIFEGKRLSDTPLQSLEQFLQQSLPSPPAAK